MKVVVGVPPNYVAISDKFHLDRLVGFSPVFAYGDTLYNPLGSVIPEALMVHEETHSKQQMDAGGAEQWWVLYIENDGFRLKQEIEAYQAQYQYIKDHSSRQVRRGELQRLARDLSSPLYGNIVKKKEAEKLIINYQ